MAAMTERRSDFSAVAFADRYILAIGGQNEKGEALASVEIYDAQELHSRSSRQGANLARGEDSSWS